MIDGEPGDLEHDAAVAAAALNELIAEAIRRGMDPRAVVSGMHGALLSHFLLLGGWQFTVERWRAAAQQVEAAFRPAEGSA